jgi:DNA-binding response OmpR family regulator
MDALSPLAGVPLPAAPPPAGAAAQPRVLVVEADHGLRQAMYGVLRDQAYEVDTTRHPSAAGDRFARFRPHLVLLDIAEACARGLELARRLRHRPGGGQCAILMLTAQDNLRHRLEGFSAGADDCIAKPVAMVELVARVKAQLRHVWSPSPEILTYADVRLDTGRRLASRGTRLAALTTSEFHLLELLMRHPGQVISPRAVGETLWGAGDSQVQASNAVAACVRRLRRKLQAGGELALIQTVRGAGYALRVVPPG